MGGEILEQFGRFRRRHLWVRGWDLFLEAGFVMTVTGAAMLLLDRLAFELGFAAPHLSTPSMVAATLGGTLALALLFAAGVLVLRPTPPVEIAWRLDRAVGGEERFLSALELAAAGGAGGFARALFRDAARLAGGARPTQVLPRVPVGYRWGILLSLAAGVLLYACPPQLYDAPLADFEASPLRGPAPLEVSFRDASIGAIDEFLWDFGDGRIGSGESVTHVFERPRTYRVVLKLRGPGGVCEKTREIEVLPSDRAAADFAAQPIKGRLPLEVRFRNLSRNAKGYQWDFGDGVSTHDEEPVHTYAQAGLYTVRLRALNDIGLDDRVREKYIKVTHPDEPLADFRAIPREGPAPLEVSFEDLSGGALSEWSWDFGDVRAGDRSFSRERNPTHLFKSPGRYTVKLKVKGPHGEDEEVKEKYIHVKDQGDGKGSGKGAQDAAQNPKADPKSNPGGAGRQPGQLFGPPPKPPPYKTKAEIVKPAKVGQELAEKVQTVFGHKPDGVAPQELRLDPGLLMHYKRVAEETMSREPIPPVMREYIRKYYESDSFREK